MAEAVDIGVGDASTLADADNEMTEGISGEGLAFLGDEQWVVGAVVGAGGFEPPTSRTRTVRAVRLDGLAGVGNQQKKVMGCAWGVSARCFDFALEIG